MIELSAYFLPQKRTPSEATVSLSATLEVYVGNYFVSGEGGSDSKDWITVYYDPDVDPETEAVEAVPSHIVAYVFSDYSVSFVLSGSLHKFCQDAAQYHISCIPVPDFESEILQCLHPDRMPQEFSRLLWIDDDFMNDETIPFDFDRFALIDDGVPYLNPKHFFVAQLIRIMEGG